MGDERILVVDDEPLLIEQCGEILAQEGYQVQKARGGQEALTLLEEERFDLLLVDLKMPGIDGVETQKRLRQIQPYLQCIVLTGHGSVESALESGKEEAFEYLLKPVDYDKLLVAISEAYKRKVELQTAKFREEVEKVQMAGMGPRGIRKAIRELEKIYGIG